MGVGGIGTSFITEFFTSSLECYLLHFTKQKVQSQ